MVPTVSNKLAIVKGLINGVSTDIMLDSGSSISLLRQDIVRQMNDPIKISPTIKRQVVTASGSPLHTVDHIQAPVTIDELDVVHDFSVVNDPITPVILGIDFLQYHGLLLDFTTIPVSIASKSKSCPTAKEWNSRPLHRYKQLWPQLLLVEGVVCRRYTPGPTSTTVTVPILPMSLRKEALQHNHDHPSAGHLGVDKTLQRILKEAYWVYMASDVTKYCHECTRCQQVKPSKPTRAPLSSVPIGRAWQMIAVDVLEVPLSLNNNRYLLVIQDYFTKWAEAIPMPDQTAARITTELVKLFSQTGIPEVLHSDQGRNFESTILRGTLEVFGINKSRTTAYHPQGDGMVERLNRSLLQMLRAYVDTKEDWEKYLPLTLYAYRTAVHSSTGYSPFQLMYGREPKFSAFSEPVAFDPTSYQAHL